MTLTNIELEPEQLKQRMALLDVVNFVMFVVGFVIDDIGRSEKVVKK